MGLILNPRGAGGSGKTELARHILAAYGWPGGEGPGGDGVEPIHRPGRAAPMGYRLRHPRAGRPLLVLGHYERRCGGCDTIRLADGGLDAVFRLAEAGADAGHDVLFEGLSLSLERDRSAALARRHALHILCLDTPPERAARHLIARRRARGDTWPLLARSAAVQREAVGAACAVLERAALVEHLGFDGALRRARELLGLGRAGGAGRGHPAPRDSLPPAGRPVGMDRIGRAHGVTGQAWGPAPGATHHRPGCG